MCLYYKNRVIWQSPKLLKLRFRLQFRVKFYNNNNNNNNKNYISMIKLALWFSILVSYLKLTFNRE